MGKSYPSTRNADQHPCVCGSKSSSWLSGFCLASTFVYHFLRAMSSFCGVSVFFTQGQGDGTPDTQGGLRTWRVLQVRQGFVQLQDVVTDEIAWRHGSPLKLMPLAAAADNRNVTGTPPRLAPAAKDGACLFRTLSMGCQAARGATAAAFDAAALAAKPCSDVDGVSCRQRQER